MKRTTIGELVGIIAVVGAAAYALLLRYYDSLPPLSYPVAVPVAGLAAVELLTARRVHLAVTHDPDARPMEAIVIARCVALGQASALVAAAMVGALIAVLVKVIPDYSNFPAARNDLQTGLVIVVASVLLLAAGLLLERSGLIPRDRGDTQVQA
jgi:hypothetical protein